MIRKELQQRMRDRRAWLLPTLYLLALGGAVAFAFYDAAGSGDRGSEVQGAEIGQAMFTAAIITQMAALLLLAPAFSAGGLNIEKEQRTLAGLLTSLLEPKDIWWGKFVCSFLFLCVLQLSALPVLSLSFAFGGIGPREVLTATGVTMLIVASLCAIGLWCSSFFRRSVHATAAAYGIIIALSIVTLVLSSILEALSKNPGSFEDQPFYVVLPILLNPFTPLVGLFNMDVHKNFYWGASLLFYAAAACLAAAGAIRNIRRSGEQV